MKFIVPLFLFFLPSFCIAQNPDGERPTYCDELPVTYETTIGIKGLGRSGSGARPALPKFSTKPTTEYKVQVAILRQTHPADFPFHKKLVARYRPCEGVWVVESKDSFSDKDDARKLQAELKKLGYRGAYLTELVAYHQ